MSALVNWNVDCEIQVQAFMVTVNVHFFNKRSFKLFGASIKQQEKGLVDDLFIVVKDEPVLLGQQVARSSNQSREIM